VKRRKLFRRKRAADGIVVFELGPSFEPDAAIAESAALLMFGELHVRPHRLIGRLATDDRLRVFGVLPRASCPLNGCVVVALPEKPLVVVHGGLCGMTQAIARDLADGKQRPFEGCARSATRSAAEVITPTKGLTK
jgi:hypothetical protein